MLTPDVLRSLERSVLCWLATADGAGRPRVSPKEIFAPLDATRLVIANIASPGSRRNLRENPQVCVSCVDVFVQKGHQLFGRATVVPRGDQRFAALAEPLEALTGGAFPIHDVIEVEVTSVAEIVAPSYRLVPGTSEAGQVAGAMATYGVRPAGAADDPPRAR